MTIQTQVEGSACYIYFNRPEKLNALTFEMVEDLGKELDKIDKIHAIRSIIITGVGHSFCAGLDVTELANCTPVQAKSRAKIARAVCQKIERSSKPIIAAVHGNVAGAGFELALCCDFIIANSDSVFMLPQVYLGLLPGFSGGRRIVESIGKYRAAKMILRGEKVKVKALDEWGIIHKISVKGKLMNDVKRLAKELESVPPLSMQLAKAVIRQGLDDKKEIEAFVKGATSKTAKARLSTVLKRKKK